MSNTSFPLQTLSIRNNLHEIQRVGEMIETFVTRHGLPTSLVGAYTLAADELLTNVISYGYEDEQEHVIHLQLKCDESALVLRLEDDGRAYNPFAAPPPDLTAELMDRPLGGLGIHLVRQLMDQVEYDREADKNVVLLTKQIPRRRELKPMECIEEKQNDITILGLRGRMDSVTAQTVEQQLLSLIERGNHHLVVDCAQLAYISSAGLRVFLMVAKRVTQAKGKLVFTRLNDDVRQVFDLTGFSSILQICSSREEALMH